MSKATQFINCCCKFIELLMAIFLAVMVILVFGNVVLRYAFNSGITVSEEVSRWLFIWITFLGAIVALREKAHLGVDMFVSRLPAIAKRFLLAACYVFMIYILWLLYAGSLEQIKINMDVAAPVTGAPQAIVYLPCLVFAIGATLILLFDLFLLLTGQLSEDQLVAVQESEESIVLAEILGNGQDTSPASQHTKK